MVLSNLITLLSTSNAIMKQLGAFQKLNMNIIQEAVKGDALQRSILSATTKNFLPNATQCKVR